MLLLQLLLLMLPPVVTAISCTAKLVTYMQS